MAAVNSSSRSKQYLGAATACLLSFNVGCMFGWTAPVGPLLLLGDAGFNVTEVDNSWIGSLLPIGATVSCVPAGFLTDYYGRKTVLLSLVPVLLLAWALLIWATSVSMLYSGRLLLGVSAGVVCVVVPVYNSEICEKQIRGAVGTSFELFIVLGITFVYTVGSCVNVFWLSVTCSVFPAVFGVIFYNFSETPVYYLSKNKRDQARTALRFYRGKKYALEAELMELTPDQHKSQEGLERSDGMWLVCDDSLVGAFRTKQAVRSVSMSVGLMAFQQLSGISAVTFYTTAIFEDAGSPIHPDYATIITGVVQILATLFITLIIERLGRRILLLLSAAMMCLSTLVVGVYFHLKINQHDVSSISWLPLASFCVYLIFYSVGFGPVPWVMIPEILPIRIKGIASSLATVVNWFCAFLVTKLFVDFVNKFGADVTYWTFSVLNGLGTIFCFFLFETKGKSFQEIQNELRK